MIVGIVGLGLIGGSFGRTLNKCGHTVYGYDINPQTINKAVMLKAIDDVLTQDNAKSLDLLVIAVNPDVFESALLGFIDKLKDGATVIDFCGTKRLVTEKMKEYSLKYPTLNFLGGHPMAGKEVSGIERSSSTLFNKASMIFCPVKADIFVLEKLKAFFLSLGFLEVVITSSENHDKMIAFTSQLCHIVSNAFIKNERASEHFGYSAGSYKDLTRVAKMDANMWSTLMIENGDNLVLELDELISNLQKYSNALHNGDKELLKTLLSEGDLRKREIDKRN